MIDERYAVYLLHFDAPLGRYKHYLGSTRSYLLLKRMRQHQTGNGARITARAVAQDIGFTLARVWRSESRNLEQQLKARGNYKKLCPICDVRLHNQHEKGPRFSAEPFRPTPMLSISCDDDGRKRRPPPLEQKRAAEAGRSRSLQGG